MAVLQSPNFAAVGTDDVVGYELHDGRLICADCLTAYDEGEEETPVYYYQPRAEDVCDDCGLRLDGEPNEETGTEEAWPERPHDLALCGFRRDR
jgi:hypothetical protein